MSRNPPRPPLDIEPPKMERNKRGEGQAPAFFLRIPDKQKEALRRAATARGMKLGTFLKACAEAVATNNYTKVRLKPPKNQLTIKAFDAKQLQLFLFPDFPDESTDE